MQLTLWKSKYAQWKKQNQCLNNEHCDKRPERNRRMKPSRKHRSNLNLWSRGNIASHARLYKSLLDGLTWNPKIYLPYWEEFQRQTSLVDDKRPWLTANTAKASVELKADADTARVLYAGWSADGGNRRSGGDCAVWLEQTLYQAGLICLLE